MRRVLLCAACVLFARSASATEYYVRAASQGNDDGSDWANAWQIDTIDWSAVHGDLMAEDVYLFFKRGDLFERDGSYVMRILYHNGSWLTHNGPQRLFLTVEPADTGPKPRFQVTEGTTAYGLLTHGDNANWQASELGYVTFDNLEIRWPYTTADYDTQKGVTGIGLHNAGDAVHVTDCDIHGCGHYSVALAHQGDRCVVTGNHFEDAGNGVYFIEEWGINGGSYHYVANNTCIRINGDLRFDVGGSIRDGHCVALQNNSWCLIEDNLSEDCRNDHVLWVAGPAACASCRGQHNVFRRNIAKRASEFAFNVGGSSTDPNPLMNMNLFYDNVAHDAASGIRQSHANAEPGNQWLHNTISQAHPETAPNLDSAVRLRRLADYHAFVNNIVEVVDAEDFLVAMTYGSGQFVGEHNRFDYNLYSHDNAAGWRYRDDSEGDFAFWRGKSATYNDPSSPAPALPLLVDPAGDDYALQAGSPAIDAGGWLTSISDAAGSGESFHVEDPYGLHDDHGLAAHGATGMPISLNDSENGRQDVMVTSVDYGTGQVTVDASVSWVGGQATQIGRRFAGAAPDIGAREFGVGGGGGSGAGGAAGSGGTGGGGGSGGSGGGAIGDGPAAEDGGCGCRLVSPPRWRARWWLSAGLALFWAARRRGPSRRTPTSPRGPCSRLR